MKISKLFPLFRKAPFPAMMTVISFVLFILVYLFVTMTSVAPYYLTGLLFAVPFVCFGTITFFTATGKIKIVSSTVMTVFIIVASGLASPLILTYIAIDAATTVTTDIGKYERVLELSSFSDHLLERCFPDQIPDNAKKVEFRYNPAFMQGGEDIALKFETDSASIKGYIDEFSKKATWVGTADDSQANQYGVFSGTLYIFEYLNSGLPKDYTIYVLFSKPYRMNDWNHGVLSLVAISTQRNAILFHAEDW